MMMLVAPDDPSHDPFDLQRFVAAQEGAYVSARSELAAGRKEGHWMWFVFPQVAGLGWSEMARTVAIRSLDDARAYLDHPVLGRRLLECADLLLRLRGRSARDVMGEPDDVKLRSSMTLFAAVSPPGSAFHRMLGRYFGGETDPLTMATLGRWEVP